MIDAHNSSPAAPDPSLIESPSHVFASKEQELDTELAHALITSGVDDGEAISLRRARLTKGEAMGGLALLSMFGVDRLNRARTALAIERRIQSKNQIGNKDGK